MIMSFFSHWFLWQAAGDLAIDEHGHIKLLCSWLVQGILNGFTPALFQLGVEQFGHGLQFPFRKSAERAMGSHGITEAIAGPIAKFVLEYVLEPQPGSLSPSSSSSRRRKVCHVVCWED